MGLQPFEGVPVVSSGFTMPSASGGLNKALVVNDLELHQGDTITLAMECKVKQLNFPPVKDTDGVQRVHVLDVEGVAVIDGATVAEAIEQQRIRAQQARGVEELPFEDPDAPDDPDTEPEV